MTEKPIPVLIRSAHELLRASRECSERLTQLALSDSNMPNMKVICGTLTILALSLCSGITLRVCMRIRRRGVSSHWIRLA